MRAAAQVLRYNRVPAPADAPQVGDRVITRESLRLARSAPAAEAARMLALRTNADQLRSPGPLLVCLDAALAPDVLVETSTHTARLLRQLPALREAVSSATAAERLSSVLDAVDQRVLSDREARALMADFCYIGASALLRCDVAEDLAEAEYRARLLSEPIPPHVLDWAGIDTAYAPACDDCHD